MNQTAAQFSFSTEVAIRTIWGEARGEPEEGQRGVAHVLVNRQASGRWGKSLAAVCMASFQFSCWNLNDPNRRQMLELPDENPALTRFREFVFAALAGEPDPTNGATHYYASTMAAPPAWIAGATACGRLGNHLFYRDVR